MAMILRATGAVTPAERKAVADRIVALVHVVAVPLTQSDNSKTALVPAVWLGTPRSRQAFMSDGLASLLPTDPGVAEERDCACFGRYSFAKKLLVVAKDPIEAQAEKKFTAQMLARDLLEGM